VTPPKGEEVKEKAKELWQELAPKYYTGQKSPAFGDSWRDKFKCRHGFKTQRKSDEQFLVVKESPYAIAQARDSLLASGYLRNADISCDVDDEVLSFPVMQSLSGKHKVTNSKTHLEGLGGINSLILSSISRSMQHCLLLLTCVRRFRLFWK
jgi:hypothetical protein